MRTQGVRKQPSIGGECGLHVVPSCAANARDHARHCPGAASGRPVSEWDELLRALAERPRENGSEELARTAAFLAEHLGRLGLDVERIAFLAHPYRLRCAGVVALSGALLYAWLLRSRRPGWALLTALALPALLLLELDFYVPVIGWPGAHQEQHVRAVLPARAPAQRLLFTAHYDTKTDLLDHVERAPVELLGVPVSLLLIGGALASLRARRRARRSRLGGVAAAVAAIYGVAMFASLSGGAFVRARSPGALDDGAACALLIRLAERWKTSEPLARTDVELVFLAAEEIGVEGSWHYARSRFHEPARIPTTVLNLEFIGASPSFGVFGRESFALRSYEPDPRLVSILDEAHRKLRGEPLYVTWYGAGTDARSFLAHGVPAATLFSDLPEHALPRHLHSVADDRSRVDEKSLDVALDYLTEVARTVDRRGP